MRPLAFAGGAAAAYSHPHRRAFSFQEKDIGLVGTVKGEAEFNLNLKIYEVPVIFISFNLN